MILAVQSRPHTMYAAIRGLGGTVLAKGDLTLVIDEVGLFINHRTQEPTGVDAWVRLFHHGSELPVDPHRIFINPPLIHNRIYDPRAAFEHILWQSVIGTPNPKGWRTRGTVTTVYASAADGYVTSVGATYSNARQSSGGSIDFFSDDTDLFLGVNNVFGGGEYMISEAFISFDTSSLPDSDSVSAAVLTLWLDTPDIDTAWTLQARTYDWGASVTTADWRGGAAFSALTLLATISAGSISPDAANDLTENGTNLQSAINKTGTTYMVLGNSNYAANSAPTGNEYVSIYSADNTGTTNDPKLVITHSASGAALKKIFNETVQVSDSVRRVLALRRRIGDTVQVSEVTRKCLALKRRINETVQISETIRNRLALKRVFAETVQVSEALRSAFTLRRRFTETVQVSETVPRRMSMLQRLAETVQISEVVQRRLAMVRRLADTVQISESMRATRAIVQRVADTVQVSTQALRRLALVRSLNDTVQVTETRVRALVTIIAKIFNDVVQLVETSKVARGFVRVFSDAVQIAEQTYRRLTMVRRLSETVQIVTNVRSTRRILLLLNDTVQVVERILRFLSLRRIVGELVQVVEGLVRFPPGQSLVVLFSDAVQMTEVQIRVLWPTLRRTQARMTRSIKSASVSMRRFTAWIRRN